ncbi:argininosuccinate lyase [Gammaproteobacteria bacterium]|nr:argininosuccinate lyase [Gammaproteobacteria bacterium]
MVKKNTSWGGRFKKQTAEKAQKFSSSINVDKKLYKEDISGSVAYAEALQSAGVINKSELAKIKSGLKQIKQKIESDKFNWQEALEDVHMNIESALEKIIGSAAKKLHTGRSRNDQVVTDLKLHLLEKSKEIKSCITDLLEVLVLKADSEVDTLMPGFTHMQIAQPITLGHHLMAWFEMLSRDLDRFEECEIRLKISPLGSGALAGNKFKINRMKLAKSLGFSEITKNSIDAVSDRDYVIEMLFNISLMGVHLSRISEELIIWSSSQFDYVDLPEELCTGSSIMPQKKNPDMAELVRGGSSKTIGNLVTLLSLIKNQPLSYNRDNQEDKGPLFDSIEYALGSLDITTAMIAGAEFNHDSMLTDVYDGHICATDLAEYLVMKGIPFRDAHAISGKAVQLAETSDLLLSELSLKDLKKLNALIEKDVFKHLDPLKSINSKSSIGGTAPSQVLKQIAHAKDKLKL